MRKGMKCFFMVIVFVFSFTTFNIVMTSNAHAWSWDDDGDKVCNWWDNCPDISNPGQEDGDGDGVGDVCDNCSDVANQDQADGDEDGVGDTCDNCKDVANQDQADSDGDGVGDACDICPNYADPDQGDSDGDGFGDVCDNCPDDANQDQGDGDGDGVGDVCDNCPDTSNPDQGDNDGNGVGNACDISLCEELLQKLVTFSFGDCHGTCSPDKTIELPEEIICADEELEGDHTEMDSPNYLSNVIGNEAVFGYFFRVKPTAIEFDLVNGNLGIRGWGDYSYTFYGPQAEYFSGLHLTPIVESNAGVCPEADVAECELLYIGRNGIYEDSAGSGKNKYWGYMVLSTPPAGTVPVADDIKTKFRVVEVKGAMEDMVFFSDTPLD